MRMASYAGPSVKAAIDFEIKSEGDGDSSSSGED
jgi:hypothetical protein